MSRASTYKKAALNWLTWIREGIAEPDLAYGRIRILLDRDLTPDDIGMTPDEKRAYEVSGASV